MSSNPVSHRSISYCLFLPCLFFCCFFSHFRGNTACSAHALLCKPAQNKHTLRLCLQIFACILCGSPQSAVLPIAKNHPSIFLYLNAPVFSGSVIYNLQSVPF